MCVITEGPAARRLTDLDEAERKAVVIGELVDRFGEQGQERRWNSTSRTGRSDRYSGGGMIGHAPTGVLTEYGYTLREPCGRIHWAGTESSTIMCGWIDGAVRSGERAAAEATAAETAAVA